VRPSIRLFEALVGVVLAMAAPVHAQGLFDSIRAGAADQPGGYVFVSERVSDTALIPLARDARVAGFTIVINGFWGDLDATRQRVARINAACCGKNGARWQINPMLFQRYQVTAVPSFVISVGPGDAPADFSKVTGEMSVANALKFFAQQSKVPAVRQAAHAAYTRAFATQ
jgi:conjugal transfer pilus assembly protein TrbC